MRYLVARFSLSVFVMALCAVAVQAQATLVLPGFSQTLLANGFTSATAMAIAPDGRIFVSQQGGQLRVVQNGTLLPTPFVSLSVNSIGERGLLGIAFDPNYAQNRFVYVYHTTNAVENGQNVVFNEVSRFTADPNNPNVALPNSQTRILRLENLSGATNHNGGAIQFGADGKLYVAVGDNATPSHSQTLNNRLGKVLRLNPDGSIPSDNPFFNTATGENRSIYLMGLRNPFTMDIQNSTGLLYVNDVGQSRWEEINRAIAGANYGWGSFTQANEGPFNAASFPQFTNPLFAYQHGNTTETGRSIAGAAFYNPRNVRTFASTFIGDYFYADFVNGWIRYIDAETSTSVLFATGARNPVDLQVGDDGALYYLSRGQGAVWRVTGQFNASVSAPEPGTALLLLAMLPITCLWRYRNLR
jgi:glucose/arabinose dehydrogenase